MDRRFESSKARDDDLLLFSEMQNREREKFLLRTVDDFEDSLLSLRRLGVRIPMSGESGDLLNEEGEKDAYDWLLSPPDTPLFQSLDDDSPQPFNDACRGRPRSQPITISKSVTDTSYQTSRTSSSSHSLSPSPRSTGTSAKVRGRASSAPHSSPPPVIQSTIPNRRPSTPSNKASSASNYGRKGTSPVKANCGHLASPKLRGFQRNLSAFTQKETFKPANIYIRSFSSSSLAFKNGRESSVRLGRKSVSPISSSSTICSSCQERGQYNSYGDNEETLHSAKMRIFRSPSAGKDRALANNKATSFTQKTFSASSNSVPKGSCDSALRLMDQRKAAQNMFRPLFSSVPTNTFHPIFTRSSSFRTSTNACFERGVTSVAPETESSEVFLFDQGDIEDTCHDVFPRKFRNSDEMGAPVLIKKNDSEYTQNPSVSNVDAASSTTLQSAHSTDEYSMVGSKTVEVCLKCGKELDILDVNRDRKLCEECYEEDRLRAAEKAHFDRCSSNICSTKLLDQSELSDQDVHRKKDMDVMYDCSSSIMHAVKPCVKVGNLEGTSISVLPLQRSSSSKRSVFQGKASHARDLISASRRSLVRDSVSASSSPGVGSSRQTETCIQPHARWKSEAGNIINDIDCSTQSMNSGMNRLLDGGMLEFHETNNGKVMVCRHDRSTELGVECLSSICSTKLPVFQGKALSAINILCSEPSHWRDDTSRRSLGRDSISPSSSVGVVSPSQTQTYRKRKQGNIGKDIDCNAQSANPNNDTSINCLEFTNLTDECEETQSSRYCYRTISTSEIKTVDHQEYNESSCCSASQIIHDDEDIQNHDNNTRSIEGSTEISGCSETGGDYQLVGNTFQKEILNATTNCSSGVGIKTQHASTALEDLRPWCLPSHNPAYLEDPHGYSLTQALEKDISLSTSESATPLNGNRNHVESSIEAMRGHISRISTLEEATAVAMEKEKKPGSPHERRPAASTRDKPVSIPTDSRKTTGMRSPKSQKFTSSDVEVTSKVRSAKPSVLECECCCVIS